ncbi:L,D-transpeptidase family protein [Marinobacter sp. HL-58]|uniref:L,D-transpeptidase family protein n=1 Tax=Marinobacter sp. HL-58 TaxID=1479237 RepID=UPI0009DE46E1|nr:L,D-transpeptidase family protein [Marinobacter sp. HL-58]
MPSKISSPAACSGLKARVIACLTAAACLLVLAGNPATASELPMGAMAEAPEVSEVLVRKEERRLYLISGEEVVRSYRIGLGDNPSGHKLYEGDKRTPEGEYVLDWRNPDSDFYKSIHISYPNKQDREQASAWGLDPGGSIMIHGLPNEAGDMAFAYLGLDWTDGCIAVSNEEMDEIWQLVADGTPIRIVP